MPISSSYRLSDGPNRKPWNTTKRRHSPKTSKSNNIKTVSGNHRDLINLTCEDKEEHRGSVQLNEITLKEEKLSKNIKGASNVFVNSKCTLERTRQQKQRDRVITNNLQSPNEAPIIEATDQGYCGKTVKELCPYPGNGRVTSLKRKKGQRKRGQSDNTKIACRNPRKAAKNENTVSLIPSMVDKVIKL